MDASQKILSDLTVYMKYAKFVPELNRRETWEELVTRNMDMHIKKYPSLKDEIKLEVHIRVCSNIELEICISDICIYYTVQTIH